MTIDNTLFFPAQDLALLAAMFAVGIFVAGSLIHFVIRELEYYQWNKQTAGKSSVKYKSKTIPKKIVAPRRMKKAKA